MRTVLASSTVLFTIASSFAIGIGGGYVVISGILKAFGHRSQQEKRPAPAVAVTTVSGR